ncbi:DUF669 domain-containing protein [Clostridium polynesiense]|uniref:DUF669 domain-containing protein n=1 Tax=Clostridium polynesiense TaxID=1325933 RepID=UPI00058F46CC|nr:DUF669 domain-containing protein [Clostridium polynesiense]
MKPLEGYDTAPVVTGEFEVLAPGGYICKIINAKEDVSTTGKKMLVLAFDIEEGEHKGYYKRRFDDDTRADKKWQGTYRQMLEGDKAAGYFKGLITTLEASNQGFKWNWDERKLKGLKFGGVFGEEEYEYNGEIKKTTKIKWVRSVEKVKNGEFKVPDIKKLPTNNNPYSGTPFDDMTLVSGDGDIPF